MKFCYRPVYNTISQVISSCVINGTDDNLILPVDFVPRWFEIWSLAPKEGMRYVGCLGRAVYIRIKVG